MGVHEVPLQGVHVQLVGRARGTVVLAAGLQVLEQRLLQLLDEARPQRRVALLAEQFGQGLVQRRRAAPLGVLAHQALRIQADQAEAGSGGRIAQVLHGCAIGGGTGQAIRCQTLGHRLDLGPEHLFVDQRLQQLRHHALLDLAIESGVGGRWPGLRGE